MRKALVVLALLAFAAFAAATVETTSDVDKQQIGADALVPLTRAGGRSLKTFGLLSWWNWWGGSGWNFCRDIDVKIDLSCFSAKRWWDSVYSDDYKCNDRSWSCGSYADKCANRCGGQDSFYQERSMTKYWCPGTCGWSGCDDFMPTCKCEQYKHLCNVYQGSCYSWYGKPIWYWCMKTCGRCGK